MIKKSNIKKIVMMLGFVIAFICAYEGLFVTMGQTSSAKVKVKLKNGVVTVSGKGAMKKKHILSKKKKKKVKKVVVKKGVTSIVDEAFDGCSKLKEVTLPKTIKKIGDSAFYECKKVKSVTLKEGLKEVDSEAFFSMESLKELVVPKTVEIIGNRAFAGNDKLTSLTMPGKFTQKRCVFFPEPDSYEGDALTDHCPVLDTVIFNTNLDPTCITGLLNVKRFEVSSTDPNYKSIDGVIYSKDGKTLVRVPGMTELNIAEGCEKIYTSAVTYECLVNDEDERGVCYMLKTIVIPESVKEIDDKSMNSYMVSLRSDGYSYAIKFYNLPSVEKVIVKTKSLSDEDIAKLRNAFPNAELVF